MDNRHPQGLRGTASVRGDDFTLIKGIGSTIRDLLYDAGILTFAQLGVSSPEKIAAAVTGLSAKRIAREKWIGQARHLASRRKPNRRRTIEAPLGGRQQYATFTVELLLDTDRNVRRTRVTHVQSGTEDTWPGWQAARLTNFLEQSAALQLPTEPVPQVTVVAEPVAATAVAELVASRMTAERAAFSEALAELVASKVAAERAASSEALAELVASKVAAERAALSEAFAERASSRVAAGRAASEAVAEPVVSKATAQPPPFEAIADVAGTPWLNSVEIVPINTDSPSDEIAYGLPFNVLLALDLSKVVTLDNAPLAYSVTLSAKRFGSRERQIVSQVRGTLVRSNTITIPVEGTMLARGAYLLTAQVALESQSAQLSDRAGREVAKWTGLLQID